MIYYSEWKNQIGVQAGKNMFEYPDAGYYSFLYTGSNVSANDTSNHDLLAVETAKNFMFSNNYKPPSPFVIFLPGQGGHPPYGSPLEYHNMWSVDEVKKARTIRPPYIKNKPQYFSKDYGIPYFHNLEGFNDSFFYDIQSKYIGRLSYMDYVFGQLWDAVKTFDKATNTSTGLVCSSGLLSEITLIISI